VFGKYEANINQNARKSEKKIDGGCLPLIRLLTQIWLQIRASKVHMAPFYTQRQHRTAHHTPQHERTRQERCMGGAWTRNDMRMDGSTKDPRPTRAHSSILLNLEVVLLSAAVRDKTHKTQQAVLGKYEANIKQNARKASQSEKG
jgi:hypothetical protein